MANFWIVLLVFLTNIVAQAVGPKILDIIVTRLSKRMERSDLRHIERDKRRVDVYQTLYTELFSMTNGFLFNTNSDQVKLIEQFNTLTGKSNLYLSDEMKKVCDEAGDYFMQLTNGNTVQDLQLEDEFLERFKKEFNK